MGFQMRGWVEQVIEVAFDGHEGAMAFQQALLERPLAQLAERLPLGFGGASLGAMVEGQVENSVFVRVSCPTALAQIAFQLLHDAAVTAASPNPPPG